MKLHVLISGNNLSIEFLDAVPDVAICPLPSPDIAVDFGIMMDKWGGGTATAVLESTDENSRFFRVAQFDQVPVTFTQTSDDSFLLDSIDGRWWLSATNGEDGLDFEQGGDVPTFSTPELRPLQAFCMAHRYLIL